MQAKRLRATRPCAMKVQYISTLRTIVSVVPYPSVVRFLSKCLFSIALCHLPREWVVDTKVGDVAGAQCGLARTEELQKQNLVVSENKRP